MVAPNSKKAIRAEKIIKAAEQEALGFKNKMFSQMYIHAVKQSVAGNGEFLRFIKQLKEAPVSIETFLDSPEFMGATDLKLWPEVRKLIVESCQDWWKGMAHGANAEILLTGGTGTGKSECCKVVTCYFLHILGCMKAPQTFYNLPSSTSIVIPIQAAKPHVTKKIIYMPMRSYIDTMPWFQRNMRPDKLIDSEMYFVGQNVRVVQGGADSDAILGDAVIAAVVDEINFMNVVQKSKRADVASGGRSGTYDQAQSVYEALIRRRKSRFITRGPQIGIMCISSSRRYKNDFTDRRQQQVEETGERGVYVYDKAQYEARPASSYCGEKFRVAIYNNASMDIRILEEGDTEPRGADIFHVPIEYYDEFIKSPAGSVRDVIGRSVNSISPFIKKRGAILEAIKRGKEKSLESIVVKDNVVLGIEGMPAVKRGVYCQNPSKPRYVHIDLSVNGDSCGIAMLRFDGHADKQRKTGEIEKLPRATIEMAIGIEPDHGAEIDLAEVRAWVKQLKDVYGYPIKAVSYDGYASIESRQQWKKVGMKTGLVSVDRTPVPYKNLRDAFYDGRIDMYDQPALVDELYTLEYDGKVGKDGKIDHPVGFCFVGETLLANPNGAPYTFEDAAKALDPLYVWAYCEETSSYKKCQAINPRITKMADVLVTVETDSGEFTCTPEHKILLTSGHWVSAEDLQEGDDIRSFF